MTGWLACGLGVVGVFLALSCGGTASLREGSGGSTSTGDSSFVRCESDASCAGVTGAQRCRAGFCRAPGLAGAGAPAQGGAGNLAGTGGSVPGSDGGMASGGMTMGSAGTSAGTSGGGSGGTGPGGMQGTGGAGADSAGKDGAGAGGAGLRQVADALDGLRLDSPCGTMAAGNVCDYPGRPDDGAPFSEMVTATMGGTPGTAYQVALHIRGVTGMTHVMGGIPGSSEYFVTGGSRYGDGANEASFEQWRLTTSSPSQHYYLNVNPSGLSHVCILIDTIQMITIDGGAMVTLDVYDGNSHQISNTTAVPPLAPPGVPGSMSSGQFIQINVDGVTM